MAMEMMDMVLALGMPLLTIVLVVLTAMVKGLFKKNPKLVWGLLISLGLFNIAMILDHTGMIVQPFLMWSHLVLPIGALLIYLGLKK
ncbi:hypothetical protein GOV03_03915 [Candidatus Woesearchaeota archaeon]|nr:hypothetical protein [Candidatus Woesearchaeota archaeon]